MEVFYWAICILVFIASVWFWGKTIKALDNFNKISERFLSITQKMQDDVEAENKRKQDELTRAILCGDTSTSNEFKIGEKVIYPPLKRVMVIKDITKDGLYRCNEITDKGEEFGGLYKANQIIKY